MSKPQLKTQNNSAFSLQYHVVFVMRYRHRCLTAEILDRLKVIFDETLIKWRCRLIEFGGESDHVHLLIDAHPSLDLSQLIGNLKTVSARKIRAEYTDYLKKFYWKPYFWSRSYAVLSVSGHVPLEKLILYVQSQEKPEI